MPPEGQTPDVAINDDAPAVPDLRDDSVADPLELVTANIDTTMMLASWLKSHPADRVATIAPVGNSIDDQFCRTAVAKTRLGGVTLVRSALFYMPAPPKGEMLPANLSDGAENQCQLGAMVLASEEMDLRSAESLRDSIAALIDKRLGPHTETVPEYAGGLGGTAGTKMWQVKITTVVAKVSLPANNAARARTFTVAYTPTSGATDFDSWEARYEERHGQTFADQQSRYSEVDSAVKWAQLPAVANDLTTVVGYLRGRNEDGPREVKPPQIDAALIRALTAIHQAAPSLPPPRRAAALLAGDIALAATYGLPSADSGHAIGNALPSLGITLEKSSDGGQYYGHPWLWEAYRTDSTGRAGRIAFVTLLGMQWPEDKSCGDEYKKVIQHGETALAKGDNNPLIHYYVGSAYRTIYDLAHWENEEVGNPAPFKPLAEPARLKAIEHFRVALQSLPDRVTRREAWIKAMLLLLRRSGDQPEYVCFPD